MRILFLGDVVGRDGRDAIKAKVPGLRKSLNLDFVIVNAENAAHGFGLKPEMCQEFFASGVDCITTGNHVWDMREIIPYIEKEPRLLRPSNYAETAPGRGFYLGQTEKGKKVLVINTMARLFMHDMTDDAFVSVDRILTRFPLAAQADAIVLDFHGEATSEKMAMGHFCDGRVSLVVGTHTHVPTADYRVLPGGTGYQSDAGMCGNYQSVIGMEVGLALDRFLRKVPSEKLRPAEGNVTLCGVVVETDDKTGLCRSISPLRDGGSLSQTLPLSSPVPAG